MPLHAKTRRLVILMILANTLLVGCGNKNSESWSRIQLVDLSGVNVRDHLVLGPRSGKWTPSELGAAIYQPSQGRFLVFPLSSKDEQPLLSFEESELPAQKAALVAVMNKGSLYKYRSFGGAKIVVETRSEANFGRIRFDLSYYTGSLDIHIDETKKLF